jgi:competence protein ComGC
MKISHKNQKNNGMTLLETAVVILSLFIFVLLLVPALSSPRNLRSRVNCVNNLKQAGLSFRIWEGDHNDKYPMGISTTNGGAMEAVARGNVVAVFQVMSNELTTPRLLVCPEDKHHHAATNFAMLAAENISYFVNPNASQVYPCY